MAELTKREHFAGLAMAALINADTIATLAYNSRNPENELQFGPAEDIAEKAVAHADALLRRLSESPE